MKLNKKNLIKHGFRASHPFADRLYEGLHWKKINNQVIFTDGHSPQIGVFILTSKEVKAFNRGDLSLVPPGCCAPTRKNIKEDCEILLDREPRSRRELEKILQAREKLSFP